jgi:hypothetical protein
MIVTPFQIAEQDIRLSVQVDRIVRDPRILQQDHKIGPDFVVPADVFGLAPRVEKHLEGMTLHGSPHQARA